MLTINDAFRKFKSNLELTDREQKDASRRQKEIREYLGTKLSIERDFLTGSYSRWTKTKPLKDVDIFCCLGVEERHYRSKPPADLLGVVEKALGEKYGRECVGAQRRSVNVNFGVAAHEDLTDENVMSFDVVPAFEEEHYFEIPDVESTSGWIKTDPEIHREKALEAQNAYNGEWKAIVRMMKYWNNGHDKPIKPSFLIEVMALKVLHPPFGGSFDREMQGLFYTLADRIEETWEDPAGWGTPVSDKMDSSRCAVARSELIKAGAAATEAIRLTREGKNGAALDAWRKLLGPLFPLS